ncbi:L,D-transpeptidase catalytic domain [Paenibacillus sp. GP183]|nr:L,D-transpeptidase catalytic domain [Paenibacillus sp. GP183]
MNRLSLSTVAAFSIITTILSGCQATKPPTSSLSETSLSSQSIQMTNRVTAGQTQLPAQVTSPIEPVVSANDAKAEKDNKFIGWNQPAGGEYPKLAEGEQIWIDVSISKQRVYIKESDKTLYTMVTSSGLDTSPDNSTPLGTYYIQPERGI